VIWCTSSTSASRFLSLFVSTTFYIGFSVLNLHYENRLTHPVVDLQGIYPAHLIPTFMSRISAFYLETYNDLFFVYHPPFFQAFMWSELLFQAPVGVWAIINLPKGLIFFFFLLYFPFRNSIFQGSWRIYGNGQSLKEPN